VELQKQDLNTPGKYTVSAEDMELLEGAREIIEPSKEKPSPNARDYKLSEDNQEMLDELYGEQFRQQELFEEWKKNPENSRMLDQLPDPWIAFRDNQVIATSKSFDGILEALEIKSLSGKCFVTRVRDYIFRRHVSNVPVRANGVSNITLHCGLDFAFNSATFLPASFQQDMDLDLGADFTSVPFDKVWDAFRAFIEEKKKEKKGERAPVPMAFVNLVLKRDPVTNEVTQIDGPCWLSIDGCVAFRSSFTARRNLPLHLQSLIGRENCLDKLGYTWVGPTISDNDLALLPQDLRSKGKVTFHTLG